MANGTSSEERWAQMEEKGFWHFVLMRGVLGWGVAMFIAMNTFRYFRTDAFPSAETLALSAVVWTAGGILWGGITYKLTGWSIRRKQRNSA
ncbi:MAG: hypothetical protein AAF830_04925 [Pseudomonadota bacterium]